MGCPANSTPASAACTCNSGFVANAGGTTCVPGCIASAECDDGVFCNGAETCLIPSGSTSGTCQPGADPCNDNNVCTTDGCAPATGCSHAPISCDDQKNCTTDSCDPAAGCAHALDAGACVCTAGTPVTVPIGGSKELSMWGVPCPVGLEGTLGAKLTLSAAGTFEKESCTNACTSSGVLAGSSAMEFNLCAGNKVTVTAEGKYAVDKKFNAECSPATCGSGCGAGYCRTDEASGSLTAAQSRFLGKDWKETFPGGRVFLKCGGTLGGSVGLGGGLKHVTSAGAAAGTCTECQAGNLSLTGTLGVAFDCTTGIEYSSMVKEVGCKKCLAGEVKVSGSRTGSCTAAPCYGLGSTGKISGDLPSAKMGFKWFTVTGACGFVTTGCSEVNTCGACTCGGASCSEFSAKFSCSVCYGNSSLPACKRSI